MANAQALLRKRQFYGFPTLRVRGLSIITGHLIAKLQDLRDGVYGPIPADTDKVFDNAITSLTELERVFASLQNPLYSIEPGAPAAHQPHPPADGTHLTSREREILKLICAGYRNNEIARHMNFGTGTIKAHIRSILEKLSATDRTQAAVIAVKRGII